LILTITNNQKKIADLNCEGLYICNVRKYSIMKLILEIKDNKAEFVMELLNSLSFVKTKPITDEKAKLMEEIKEAVENLNLVKKGKVKARPAKELLNEL
jgi:hypothetical protein